MNGTHVALGLAGERYVAGVLAVDLELACVRSGTRGDLIIPGARFVEVKTSRFRPKHGALRSRRYKFCLHRKGRAGFDADFLVLVCWDKRDKSSLMAAYSNRITTPDVKDCYIIPASHIEPDRAEIVITSDTDTYDGTWAPYLNAWEWLSGDR